MAKTLFHKGHYNILAKRIREELELYYHNTRNNDAQLAAGVLSAFAFSLARRLEQDNPLFDALQFLRACSPSEKYSLADAWMNMNDSPQ